MRSMLTLSRWALVAILLTMGVIACDEDVPSAEPDAEVPPGTTVIPPPEIRRTGDAEAGWAYVRYGDFVGTGMPIEVFKMLVGRDEENLLQREGDSADLPPFANAFDAPNGVRVASGTTCMGCHASKLGDGFVPGLGNTFLDFTPDVSSVFNLLERFLGNRFEADSPEAAISALYLRGARATQHQIRTEFRGTNSAMRMAVAAAAHRVPADLSWSEETVYDIPETALASDVPPLWHVKKKHALYYNGMGRGDFARLIMQIGVVAIVDAEQAADIDTHAPDLLAWIEGLEAPRWPGSLDGALVAQGELVFLEHCARCHGTYGEAETYPNLLVSIEAVGTDPEYARFFAEGVDYVEWFNSSWYADGTAWTEPALGYMAPPLDGVWASAPYLHNGSIPTLDAVLDSSLRPARWRRDYDDTTYDLERVGWPWTRPEEGASDIAIYDTTAFGYSNQGHVFADGLSDEGRRALLEYLKTL